MSVSRVVTCFVDNLTINRIVSSDSRVFAGYVGEDHSTQIKFVLSGSIWDGLLKKCIILSPSQISKLSIALDDELSFTIPKEILDAQGPVSFTLTGYHENAPKIYVKTGISTLDCFA